MKILNYLTAILFCSVLLVSCEKEYESYITKETPAPEMELFGDDPMVIFKGTTYDDPGIHAVEISNGDTTELDYEVINEVKVDVPGTYRLLYKAMNSEDVPFYLSRRVSVVSFTGYDVYELPEGTWDGIRVSRDAGGEVQIKKLAPGVYQISDLLAGYYDQYVGYGPETAGPGILVINENGEIRSELGNTVAWGGVTGENFSFDEENNVLNYTIVFDDDGFSFDVQLTFKQ